MEIFQFNSLIFQFKIRFSDLISFNSFSIKFNDIWLIEGKTYKISFDCWGDQEKFVIGEVCIDAPNANWDRYWYQKVTVTDKVQTIEATFTYDRKDDPGARFEFNLGAKSNGIGTIYLANVRVEEVTD